MMLRGSVAAANRIWGREHEPLECAIATIEDDHRHQSPLEQLLSKTLR